MYTFQQIYNKATPPAVGEGSGICIPEDATLTISALDKYNQTVNTRSQYLMLTFDTLTALLLQAGRILKRD